MKYAKMCTPMKAESLLVLQQQMALIQQIVAAFVSLAGISATLTTALGAFVGGTGAGGGIVALLTFLAKLAGRM